MRIDNYNRRDFIKAAGLGASAFVLGGQVSRSNRFTVERILPYDYRQCPSYLKDYELVKKSFPQHAEVARQAWQANRLKHNEICDTLQPKGWGYIKTDNGKHKKNDHVLNMLAQAEYQNCNLLLNTGPLPDGSIHPEDVTTLREVGKKIKEKGFPAPAKPVESKLK